MKAIEVVQRKGWALLVAGLAMSAAGCYPCTGAPDSVVAGAVSAAAGQPLDTWLPLDPQGPGTAWGVAHVVDASGVPPGLEVQLNQGHLRLSGTVVQPGAYHLVVQVKDVADQACAAWAEYDVSLWVAPF